MNCEELQELVPAYADRELDLVKSVELERHLSECRACSDNYARLQSLRSAVGELYQAAPASLERRVVSAVRKAGKGQAKPRTLPWRLIGVTATLVLLLALIWSVVRLSQRTSSDEALAREVVASHVRSLMVDHLADVPSSDQHTVKPWFNGKLDFSPGVPDLSEHGFVLIGGRVDYIDDQAVAALVYQRRNHIINLLIWPARDDRDTGDRTITRRGYNAVKWNESGMSCWAVSDLNSDELHEFSQLLRNIRQ